MRKPIHFSEITGVFENPHTIMGELVSSVVGEKGGTFPSS